MRLRRGFAPHSVIVETHTEATRTAMAQAPKEPAFRYQDAPELMETFADSIGQCYFDGDSLRIEFLVSRLDAGAAAEQPTRTKRPACRIVLSPTGAVDLLNRCQQIVGALQKKGALKARTNPTEHAAN